jgi:hypothetical protein
MRAILPPLETYSPLEVNTDAHLTLPVPPQRLEMIARKVHQIFNTGRTFENLQPLFSLLRKRLKTRDTVTMIKFFSLLASEGTNHKVNLEHITLYVKRKTVMPN